MEDVETGEPVTLMRLFLNLLKHVSDGHENYATTKRIIRLLGILTPCGVQPKDMREILDQLQTHSDLNICWLQAIKVMMKHDKAITKAAPPSFFNFGGLESGLFSVLRPFPFQKEYQIFTWFRVESFMSDAASSGSSTPGSVLPRPFNPSQCPSIASVACAECVIDICMYKRTLVVSVASGRSGSDVNNVIVEYPEGGGGLRRGVWYHICVKHRQAGYASFFGGNDELTIHMDQKLIYSGIVKYPSVSRKVLTEFSVGRNFDGQITPVYFLSESMLTASVTTIAQVDAGKAMSTADQGSIVFQADIKVAQQNTAAGTNNSANNTSSSGSSGTSGSHGSKKITTCYHPDRVSYGHAIDIHDGRHARIGANVFISHLAFARDSLEPLGGVQALFPVFPTLLIESEDDGEAHDAIENGNIIATATVEGIAGIAAVDRIDRRDQPFGGAGVHKKKKSLTIVAPEDSHERGTVNLSARQYSQSRVSQSPAATRKYHYTLRDLVQDSIDDGVIESHALSSIADSEIDSSKEENYLSLLIGILSRCIESHLPYQQELLRYGGIEMIEYLLLYNAEISAFRLVPSCITEIRHFRSIVKDFSELETKVTKHILCNFSIWCRADFDVQSSVISLLIDDMKRSGKNFEYYARVCSVSQLLFVMEKFYMDSDLFGSHRLDPFYYANGTANLDSSRSQVSIGSSVPGNAAASEIDASRENVTHEVSRIANLSAQMLPSAEDSVRKNSKKQRSSAGIAAAAASKSLTWCVSTGNQDQDDIDVTFQMSEHGITNDGSDDLLSSCMSTPRYVVDNVAVSSDGLDAVTDSLPGTFVSCFTSPVSVKHEDEHVLRPPPLPPLPPQPVVPALQLCCIPGMSSDMMSPSENPSTMSSPMTAIIRNSITEGISAPPSGAKGKSRFKDTVRKVVRTRSISDMSAFVSHTPSPAIAVGSGEISVSVSFDEMAISALAARTDVAGLLDSAVPPSDRIISPLMPQVHLPDSALSSVVSSVRTDDSNIDSLLGISLPTREISAESNSHANHELNSAYGTRIITNEGDMFDDDEDDGDEVGILKPRARSLSGHSGSFYSNNASSFFLSAQSTPSQTPMTTPSSLLPLSASVRNARTNATTIFGHSSNKLATRLSRAQRSHLRAGIRSMIVLLILMSTEPPNGNGKNAVGETASHNNEQLKSLLGFMTFCRDTTVLFEISQLVLSLLIGGRSSSTTTVNNSKMIMTAVTEEFVGAEEFASCIMLKLVNNPSEDIRFTGLRLLTHYYLRLPSLPTSLQLLSSAAFHRSQLLAGNYHVVHSGGRTTLEYPHDKGEFNRLQLFGGIWLLNQILESFADISTIRTYSGLLEMLLLHADDLLTMKSNLLHDYDQFSASRGGAGGSTEKSSLLLYVDQDSSFPTSLPTPSYRHINDSKASSFNFAPSTVSTMTPAATMATRVFDFVSPGIINNESPMLFADYYLSKLEQYNHYHDDVHNETEAEGVSSKDLDMTNVAIIPIFFSLLPKLSSVKVHEQILPDLLSLIKRCSGNRSAFTAQPFVWQRGLFGVLIQLFSNKVARYARRNRKKLSEPPSKGIQVKLYTADLLERLEDWIILSRVDMGKSTNSSVAIMDSMFRRRIQAFQSISYDETEAAYRSEDMIRAEIISILSQWDHSERPISLSSSIAVEGENVSKLENVDVLAVEIPSEHRRFNPALLRNYSEKARTENDDDDDDISDGSWLVPIALKIYGTLLIHQLWKRKDGWKDVVMVMAQASSGESSDSPDAEHGSGVAAYSSQAVVSNVINDSIAEMKKTLQRDVLAKLAAATKKKKSSSNSVVVGDDRLHNVLCFLVFIGEYFISQLLLQHSQDAITSVTNGLPNLKEIRLRRKLYADFSGTYSKGETPPPSGSLLEKVEDAVMMSVINGSRSDANASGTTSISDSLPCASDESLDAATHTGMQGGAAGIEGVRDLYSQHDHRFVKFDYTWHSLTVNVDQAVAPTGTSAEADGHKKQLVAVRSLASLMYSEDSLKPLSEDNPVLRQESNEIVLGNNLILLLQTTAIFDSIFWPDDSETNFRNSMWLRFARPSSTATDVTPKTATPSPATPASAGTPVGTPVFSNVCTVMIRTCLMLLSTLSPLHELAVTNIVRLRSLIATLGSSDIHSSSRKHQQQYQEFLHHNHISEFIVAITVHVILALQRIIEALQHPQDHLLLGALKPLTVSVAGKFTTAAVDDTSMDDIASEPVELFNLLFSGLPGEHLLRYIKQLLALSLQLLSESWTRGIVLAAFGSEFVAGMENLGSKIQEYSHQATASLMFSARKFSTANVMDDIVAPTLVGHESSSGDEEDIVGEGYSGSSSGSDDEGHSDQVADANLPAQQPTDHHHYHHYHHRRHHRHQGQNRTAKGGLPVVPPITIPSMPSTNSMISNATSTVSEATSASSGNSRHVSPESKHAPPLPPTTANTPAAAHGSPHQGYRSRLLSLPLALLHSSSAATPGGSSALASTFVFDENDLMSLDIVAILRLLRHPFLLAVNPCVPENVVKALFAVESAELESISRLQDEISSCRRRFDDPCVHPIDRMVKEGGALRDLSTSVLSTIAMKERVRIASLRLAEEANTKNAADYWMQCNHLFDCLLSSYNKKISDKERDDTSSENSDESADQADDGGNLDAFTSEYTRIFDSRFARLVLARSVEEIDHSQDSYTGNRSNSIVTTTSEVAEISPRALGSKDKKTSTWLKISMIANKSSASVSKKNALHGGGDVGWDHEGEEDDAAILDEAHMGKPGSVSSTSNAGGDKENSASLWTAVEHGLTGYMGTPAHSNASVVDLRKSRPAWSQAFDWKSDEKMLQNCEVIIAKAGVDNSNVKGEVIVTNRALYIHYLNVPDSSASTVGANNVESHPANIDRDTFWELDWLEEMYCRRYLQKVRSISLYFVDNSDILLIFSSPQTLRKFCGLLRYLARYLRMQLPSHLTASAHNTHQLVRPDILMQYLPWTDRWCKRQISTYEYLMRLNIIAGRSFQDLCQYPVFPWILSDYGSAELTLANAPARPISSKLQPEDPLWDSQASIFRDLSKPMGALDDARFEYFWERFTDNTSMDNNLDDETDINPNNFMYGSHYSTEGYVLYYMLRQEPFTTMSVRFQGGRFDCPDRLFIDIGKAWESSSCRNHTDVKELIPEFFTCPEILLNTNKLPLGELQQMQVSTQASSQSQDELLIDPPKPIRVDDVVLPAWANGSAFEFIRIHREALESDYVSAHIHDWIDLIFGFKQTGPAAVEAKNVFRPLTYETNNIDIDSLIDETDRRAIEDEILYYGQTPSRLFTRPHPKRKPREECLIPLCAEATWQALANISLYTPSKQYQGPPQSAYQSGSSQQKSQPVACAVVGMQICGDRLIVAHADFTVVTYKFNFLVADTSEGTPFQLKFEKDRQLPMLSHGMSPDILSAQTFIPLAPTQHKKLRKNTCKPKKNARKNFHTTDEDDEVDFEDRKASHWGSADADDGPRRSDHDDEAGDAVRLSPRSRQRRVSQIYSSESVCMSARMMPVYQQTADADSNDQSKHPQEVQLSLQPAFDFGEDEDDQSSESITSGSVSFNSKNPLTDELSPEGDSNSAFATILLTTGVGVDGVARKISDPNALSGDAHTGSTASHSSSASMSTSTSSASLQPSGGSISEPPSNPPVPEVKATRKLSLFQKFTKGFSGLPGMGSSATSASTSTAPTASSSAQSQSTVQQDSQQPQEAQNRPVKAPKNVILDDHLFDADSALALQLFDDQLCKGLKPFTCQNISICPNNSNNNYSLGVFNMLNSEAHNVDPGSCKVVTVGYWDNSLRVHTLEGAAGANSNTLKECAVCSGGIHNGAITCVVTGRLSAACVCITGGVDCTVRVWVVDNVRIAHALAHNTRFVHMKHADSYHNTANAAGGSSGESSGSAGSLICAHVLRGHQSPVRLVQYSSELDLCLSVGEDGLVCVHSVTKGQFIRSITDFMGQSVDVVRIAAAGYIVVYSASMTKMRVYWVNGQMLGQVVVSSRYSLLTLKGLVACVSFRLLFCTELIVWP
jgi:hypothetical protein